jgi:type II secretory ATPase GspE/PulE/Tfp pilus assembly ATPase PilB-like protein
MIQKSKEIILKPDLLEASFLDNDFGADNDEVLDTSPVESSLLYIYSKNSKDQADTLIADAINLSASDIHIQPSKAKTEVRFRIKGEMSSGRYIRHEQYIELIGRYKILAQMRIDIKDIPQDGSFGYLNYRIRVSTMPGVEGECMVLRVLDSASLKIQHLTDTGMSFSVFQNLLESLRKSPGLVIFSGPTGSGKSTSAYSLLTSLVEENKQVLTIEDPVEKRLDGLRQVQIRPQSGFNYSQALKASMRQDPDVIYVGEIRDSDTMKSVMSLALTGHTVVTTIHARDIRMAVRRCRYLGADSYEFSMVLKAIFNQRLEAVGVDAEWNFEQIAIFESLINDKDGDAYGVFINENDGRSNEHTYRQEFTYESMEEDKKNKEESDLVNQTKI